MVIRIFLLIYLFVNSYQIYAQNTATDVSKDIDLHIDEFTDKLIRNSPNWEYPSGKMNEVVFYSVQKYKVKKSIPEYYVELRLLTDRYEIPGRGVILLFDDGSTTKFSRPDANVKVEYDEETKLWKYSSYIKITSDELNLFINKPIYKYRIYIFDDGVPFKKRALYQQYAKAIKK